MTRRLIRQSGGVSQIWQRNYYEHIIRDQDEWNRIYLYIECNPSRWATDEENPALAWL